mmetsp:Transcript_19298/g.58284  ORF Transcript_19298/g.58284 Transcript_19298/m.58284 type:complete len:576 (+) Transcript_19298:406-2133(+)
MRAKVLRRTSSLRRLHQQRLQRSWRVLGPLVVVLVTLATVGLPPWSGDAVPMSDAGERVLDPPKLLQVENLTSPGEYLRQAGDLPANADGKQPGLVVRYAACGGLFNQHYCHIAGISAAIALGAETVIMPPAMKRTRYVLDARKAKWNPAPTQSLWDVERLAAYLKTKGVTVITVPPMLPSWEPDGFGGFNPFGMGRIQVVRFPYIANELFTMKQFVARARDRVIAYMKHITEGPSPGTHAALKWREYDGELVADLRPNIPHWAKIAEESASWLRPDSLLRMDARINKSDWQEGVQVWELLGRYLVNQTFAADWGFPINRPPDDVIPNEMSDPQLRDDFEPPVDAGAGVTAFRVQPHPRRLEVLLPCILFGLRAENSPLMSEVAMNLHFAPQLQDMASRVMRGMRRESGKELFNGLHLRLEADASAWIELFGGTHKIWKAYMRAISAANFTTGKPLFVASGIFAKMTNTNRQHLKELQKQFASHIFDKTVFLGKRELKALHSEQRAAIDFLILVHSRAFVGIGTSTFSVFVDQYRKLHRFKAPEAQFVVVKRLHPFTRDMMRQGAVFNTQYPLDS